MNDFFTSMTTAEFFLLIVMNILAIYVFFAANLFNIIMAMSLFSMTLAILYIFMSAPDVALTEAAIGALLSTVFLVMCLPIIINKSKIKTDLGQKPNIFFLLLVFIAICCITAFVSCSLPIYGDINTPAYSHVSSYYIKNTIKDIGIPSAVAAILASYRGFDTLGETLVITIAGIIFYSLTTNHSLVEGKTIDNKSLGEEYISSRTKKANKNNYLTFLGFKILFPIIAIFIFYVQIFGEISPGGGFQAGAMMASITFFYIWLQEEFNLSNLKENLFKLSMLGFGIYFFVGCICVAMGGKYLEYAALGFKTHGLGIFVIELGVFITVFSVLLLIAIILMEKSNKGSKI